MSDTTNVIAKQKQLYYNAGTTSNAVSDAVDALNDIHMNVQLPSAISDGGAAAAANSELSFALPLAAKLVGANFGTTMAMTNTAGDTIAVTVTTNAVSAATFDSDDLAATASAGDIVAFTVNSTVAAFASGEKIKVEYTLEDNTNNYLDGILTLTFRRQ